MEIKIGKTSDACVACERRFEHDEELTSMVYIADGVLVRQDYCGQCWDTARGKGAFSIWHPRFYDPKVAEQEPPEAFSPLRQLFYEAVEAEERLEQAKAYLAAQLLRRQKVFRLVKESDELEEEVKILLYTDRIGNRLIEVRDPSFSYRELEDARLRLLQRLQELENPEPEEVPEEAEVSHTEKKEDGSDS